jgi:hypothetical protein
MEWDGESSPSSERPPSVVAKSLLHSPTMTFNGCAYARNCESIAHIGLIDRVCEIYVTPTGRCPPTLRLGRLAFQIWSGDCSVLFL